LTLLSKEERPYVVKGCPQTLCFYVPFSSSQLPPLSSSLSSQLLHALRAAHLALLDGTPVIIHCSDGVQRSGMAAYALFRIMGLDKQASEELLGKCLSHIKGIAKVKPQRLLYVDQLLQDTEICQQTLEN